ncbi:hypothetical protein EAI_04422 [Harpegnathos saltator]|uniref:Uncharacterized protein n=1 Tax=Harpegnathos saltator TaxID=610380 RepID=E2BIB9_HARSA|nr:hypothetical protein EAI_04422 [Harpegnathos saltator]
MWRGWGKIGNSGGDLKGWDIMVLSETWIDEGGGGKVKKELPKGFRWECQGAKRRSRKGKVIGGMVIGVREGMEVRREEEEE